MKILKDGNNIMNTNSYLIYDEETLESYLIDAPTKTRKFIDIIEEKGLKLKYLILTHGHWDHILKIDFWRDKYGLKVVAHENCKDYLENPKLNGSFQYSNIPNIKTYADIYLKDDMGEFEIFKYFYTPGHSYDSITLKKENDLFVGDVIFHESVGRTDLLGSNTNDLIKSIRNIIYNFEDDSIIHPGHGRDTTVEHEKYNNPFVPL